MCFYFRLFINNTFTIYFTFIFHFSHLEVIILSSFIIPSRTNTRTNNINYHAYHPLRLGLTTLAFETVFMALSSVSLTIPLRSYPDGDTVPSDFLACKN